MNAHGVRERAESNLKYIDSNSVSSSSSSSEFAHSQINVSSVDCFLLANGQDDGDHTATQLPLTVCFVCLSGLNISVVDAVGG